AQHHGAGGVGIGLVEHGLEREPVAGDEVHNLESTPWRRDAKAASERAAVPPSGSGTAPSRSTHEEHPRYSSSAGVSIGPSTRWARTASTHRGSRFFHRRRFSA